MFVNIKGMRVLFDHIQDFVKHTIFKEVLEEESVETFLPREQSLRSYHDFFVGYSTRCNIFPKSTEYVAQHD